LAFSDAHIAEIEAADWIGSDMSTAQVDELRNALDGVRHGAQALRANEAIAAQLADMETALCQADSE
jgi:riboflavin biosynthesis pyrimidine reductase